MPDLTEPHKPNLIAGFRPWALLTGPGMLVLALIVITLFFSLALGIKEGGSLAGFDSEAAWRFVGMRNVTTITRQTAIVGTAALGMTLVIILGGIDLSVGSIVALSTVAMAWTLMLDAPEGARAGLDHPTLFPVIAIGAGILAGIVSGLLNGGIIVGFRVVPFIVTLATMLFLRGAAKGIAGSQKIDAPFTWLADLLGTPRPGSFWSYTVFPPGVWIMLGMMLLVAGMMRYTRLGRHIYAVGSNEQTARLCGIAVGRVKLIVYTMMGALAGLAGVMQFSRLTVGDPTVAVGLELEVIAAVVIGGGSLSGGEGSVLGALLGALIISVIATGCSQLGLDNYVQEMVTGAIIVVAVGIDRWRHRGVGS